MSLYGIVGADVGLGDQKDLILMRADFHQSFDDRMFVVTPKEN